MNNGKYVFSQLAEFLPKRVFDCIVMKYRGALKELWRIIVFYICVSNTDDHLRNHGFILTDEGWILSPAYDINPEESGSGLSLNISEDNNSLDINLAKEVAEYFRIDSKESDEIIGFITSVVKRWRYVATEIGISVSEQELMSNAFRNA